MEYKKEEVFQMKKKLFSGLLCGVLAIAAVTGCGSANKAEATNESAKESVTVEGAAELSGKLVMMTNSTGGTYEAVEGIVQDFMNQNPGVKIDLSSQGSDDESLMKAKMAANDLPDVIATHGWSVNRYSEYLLTLNDQDWYQNLDDEIIPVISDKNGTIYTMPLNIDKAGIIYNTAILEKIGCDIPKTLDQLLDCCGKAKAAGYTPVYLAGKDAGKTAGLLNILLNSFMAAGEDNEVEALKAGTITDDAFVPVFDFVVELKDKGYFNVDYVTADPTSIPEKLASGQVLFALESNSTMADAYALNSNSTLAMMPVPTTNENTKVFLTGGEKEAYGIWKDSKNQKLAKALLNFMARPENIEKVSAGSGMPVSMKNATSNLDSKIQESYDKYSDIRVLNKFDRECFPNGMWSTMKTVGTSLIAGDLNSKEASKMFFTDYTNFKSQNK